MTVPYTFANQSGIVPASELDANFAAVGNLVNSANVVVNNAQPNITSVGVLANLNVSGNVVAGTFVGCGSQLTGLLATRVGVLSGLTVTGTVIAGSFAGSGAGLYCVMATRVGVLSNLSVVGNISGGNTYANGNVTANYFIGNGSQLTGITTSYNNANVQAYLPTDPTIIGIENNISTLSNTVILNNNVLTSAIGNTNSNVSNLNNSVTILQNNVASLSGNVYNNSNVAAYLPTYSGNVGSVLSGGYVHGNGYYLTGIAGGGGGCYGNSNVTTLLSSGNISTAILTTGNISTTGNVSGNYFIGNGSQLTGIVSTSNYSNSNVAAYLASGSLAGNIITTGNIQGSYFNGNGAGLTNIVGANVTGVVANATAAATVTTAAQPNITSIGTLNSLSVNGKIIVSSSIGNVLSTTGNISSGYIYGNGAFLTGIAGGGGGCYGNSNVTTLLSSGNISTAILTTGNISTTGTISGILRTCSSAIAIGRCSGTSSQQAQTIAIGCGAGAYQQCIKSIAIGKWAGKYSQQAQAVAIGCQAGEVVQGTLSVAVGFCSGRYSQSGSAVAIGPAAGFSQQAGCSVAVGMSAGYRSQGSSTVSVGAFSGSYCQKEYAVAIGVNAGFSMQGHAAIAIGYQAGNVSQANNTIIINATGNVVNGNTSQICSFYVAPIRNAAGPRALLYCVTSKEITQNNTINLSGNISGSNLTTAGLVSAGGNVTGSNLTTTGLVSAGNAITSAANVSGANLTTVGLVSAGGNVYGLGIVTIPIVGTITSGATITPSTAYGQYEVTALAVAASIAIPTGTAADGQKLIIRIKDNGTPQILSWITTAGGYRPLGVVLPTTTVANTPKYVSSIYNAQDSFWDVVSVN